MPLHRFNQPHVFPQDRRSTREEQTQSQILTREEVSALVKQLRIQPQFRRLLRFDPNLKVVKTPQGIIIQSNVIRWPVPKSTEQKELKREIDSCLKRLRPIIENGWMKYDYTRFSKIHTAMHARKKEIQAHKKSLLPMKKAHELKQKIEAILNGERPATKYILDPKRGHHTSNPHLNSKRKKKNRKKPRSRFHPDPPPEPLNYPIETTHAFAMAQQGPDNKSLGIWKDLFADKLRMEKPTIGA